MGLKVGGSEIHFENSFNACKSVGKVKYMHLRCFLHCDIKADSFIMGLGRKANQAAAIVQAVEEQFLSQLRTAAQSFSPIIKSNNSASLVNQSDAPVADNTQLAAGLDSSSQQSEDHHVEIDQNGMHLEPNQIGEGDINPQQAHCSVVVEQTGEDLQAHVPALILCPCQLVKTTWKLVKEMEMSMSRWSMWFLSILFCSLEHVLGWAKSRLIMYLSSRASQI